MSWRTGCNSMRRNPMTAIVQRPGREVVAFEMRVRLALAVPRGGVGNSNRLGPRPRDARANRARPTPVDPRGTNSGTTNAREAAMNEAAERAHALVVQPGQDAAPSRRWSAFESRRGRCGSVAEERCARPQNGTMQVQVL